ncbi:MAG: arginine--tRNA ligase [Candidatus Kerfeldbacteria bacterium]|nr:arginine--tRNA ligase [Candidatus Kerfeldbacteria bacterium]
MLSQKLQAEVLKIAHEHYQLTPQDVELEATRDLVHGDYTTNAALRVASKWGVPPRQAAGVLLEQLRLSKLVNTLCGKVEVAGPGFINFWLKPELLVTRLGELTNTKDRAVLRGQRVLVDYSSPNIAKPMHIGHIRSTIIGQALVNLYQALGAKVTGINHLGDWGTQFGKLIAAYKLWGNRAAVHKHPIQEMLRLYVKFHEVLKTKPELAKEGQLEFRKLEQGDRQSRSLWNWFKRESLREFGALYKRLGVKFTYITGESFYEPMLRGAVADLVKRKLAVKNADGSIVVHLEAEGLPPCLIQKSDGGSLYVTRDLATMRYRLQRFKPHKILYVVANQQALHFEQLFAVVRRAGYSSRAELDHIKFGLVLGEDGLKLATREGRIIKLEDVLAEAVIRARKIVDSKNSKLSSRDKARVAEAVGVGAVKYNDLSQNRQSDIAFNWDKMLSLEGNSAPYLQYTYVRLKSILRKAGEPTQARSSKSAAGELLYSITERDLTLLRMLSRYPDAIGRAAKENGPHLLAGYLYELANSTNSYYQDSPVLTAGVILRPFRLHVVSTAAAVLKEGLGILGIATVEKM